ncbi:MAG: DnaJ domain-containing protein [Sumerlaeia bacterium]
MRILYVSEQDLCRGPMARVLSMKIAKELQAFGTTFDSAGVRAVTNEPPPEDLTIFMRTQRLNIASHASRPLTSTLARQSDVLLCMTHALAREARDMLSPNEQGKVLVFRKAVGLGKGVPAQEDIGGLEVFDHKDMMRLFVELKAITGRLVREIVTLDATPEDLGVKGVTKRVSSLLDQPEMRRFLAQAIRDHLERTFEPATTQQLCEWLQTLGRPLVPADVEELIAEDLSPLIQRDDSGRWDIDERVKADEERRARDQRARRVKEREEARERANAKANGAREAPPPPDDGAKLTREEAYALLMITPNTAKHEASKTYKKLLMRYHPDKFHDDEGFRQMAEAKAKRINEAWALVKDSLE